MAYYRCGPTAIGSRASWSVTMESKLDRLNYDRIFNAFERTNAFEYVRNTFEGKPEERHVGHCDIVVNRKMSSSFERADCALAAQTPCDDDEDFYREKVLYSQARELFPLQEDLADWINTTIGITYLSGENFLDALDTGAELCQLAAVIHERAREALDQGHIVGPVPAIRGRCWQRAARRSFFSRDNAENFITFCRELGVHENLLFESDDLVLHNQPRQVTLCLLEVARLATKFNVEPPRLVQLEEEIAMEERDSGLDSSMSGTAWQFRDSSPSPTRDKSTTEPLASSPEPNDGQRSVADNVDAESIKSGGTESSTDTDVPLKPTNELDKRVQLVTRLMERGCNCGSGKCSKLLKVKKVGEGRYNIAGKNVFIRLLKGRHMMVRVGGGWETLEHYLSRHEPCQVRLVTQGRRDVLPLPPLPPTPPSPNRGSPSPASSKNSLTKELPCTNTRSTPSPNPRTSPSPNPRTSPSPNPRTSPTPNPRTSPSPNPRTSPCHNPRASPSSASSKNSLTKESSRTVSPVDSKASSISGKVSPIESKLKTPKKSVKSSVLERNKSALTLPLNDQKKGERARKQSAPASFSTPNTPTGRSTRTPVELRKSLTSNALVTTPKKSRSMSLAIQKDAKFCGTDRLNQKKNRSASIASTPTELVTARKMRSQSLASTPVNEPKRLLNGYSKTRSMSLAGTGDFSKRINKSSSLTTGLTQAAIEESIRLSLEATIADTTSSKKPFLHIKAKYRSPPPRDVPPR